MGMIDRIKWEGGNSVLEMRTRNGREEECIDCA